MGGQKRNEMSKIISLLIVVILLSAAGMFLYPTLSDQYNRFQNARRISDYERVAENLNPEENQEMLAQARAYNETLKQTEIRDAFTDAETSSDAQYRALLDPNGDGIMGYIEIPKIGVRLPIYHSTDDYGLQRGVGHMEGTALPVGGTSTHCGLAGHRALPSARLFTDLDQLVRGDLIYICVLGEVLMYQVDQISVVLPHELDYMAVEEGADLVTLVTCTPYGLNTHRLLVRGRRVTMDDVVSELALRDAVERAEPWQGVLICAIPFAVAGTLLVLLIRPRRKSRKNKPVTRK